MERERTRTLSFDEQLELEDRYGEGVIGWGVGLAVAATVLAIVAGYLALNAVANQVLVGWLCALAVPALPFAVVGRRLATALPERRRKIAVVVGLCVLAGSLFTARSTWRMRPTFPQLAAAMSGADLPEGYRLVREAREGDRLCRNACPRVLRYYDPPSGVTDPVEAVVRRLYQRGWSPEDAAAPGGVSPAVLKGRFRAHVLLLEDGRVRVYLDTRA